MYKATIVLAICLALVAVAGWIDLIRLCYPYPPQVGQTLMPISFSVFACVGWILLHLRESWGMDETRCRKCRHILRGITEPRCPECGERI